MSLDVDRATKQMGKKRVDPDVPAAAGPIGRVGGAGPTDGEGALSPAAGGPVPKGPAVASDATGGGGTRAGCPRRAVGCH
jgi:hypothetical protein